MAGWCLSCNTKVTKYNKVAGSAFFEAVCAESLISLQTLFRRRRRRAVFAAADSGWRVSDAGAFFSWHAIVTLQDARTHQVRGRRMRRGKRRRRSWHIGLKKGISILQGRRSIQVAVLWGNQPLPPLPLYLYSLQGVSQPSSNIITCARRRLFNLLATREPEQQLKRLLASLLNYLFVHFRHAFLSNAAENGILLSLSHSLPLQPGVCCEWLSMMLQSAAPGKWKLRTGSQFHFGSHSTMNTAFTAEAIPS
jgi:hypothetical protein